MKNSASHSSCVLCGTWAESWGFCTPAQENNCPAAPRVLDPRQCRQAAEVKTGQLVSDTWALLGQGKNETGSRPDINMDNCCLWERCRVHTHLEVNVAFTKCSIPEEPAFYFLFFK